MSLEQYNSLMSSMLNQQYTLTRLRAEIEEREERMYWKCRKFGYLIHNCRNKKEKTKGKLVLQNKFKVIASRVMQYGMKEKVKVRKQKTVEKRVQYFRCWGVGHYKWEYPNIKVEKKRRKSREVVYVVSSQKVQQEERPAHFLWKKTQKYCGERGMSPRGIALEKQEQKTRWEIVIFVESGGYKYKDTKIQENQGQSFVSGEQLKNIWYSQCLEVWRQRENSAKERRAVKVKCT